ncbi:MAG TPA: hypothetical protein VJV03_05825 [Pyrinomonadaceae bacterium]|nr:hypothetical protein [Pyrinomonadaceae bacterium]
MKRTFLTSLLLVLLSVAFTLTACNRGGNSSDAPPPPPPSPKTGFEADLEWMRKGQYTYIWVFSRKDGKPIDSEDADYLRKNAPQVVDVIISEQGKKAIAGTNFDLAQGNLGLLQQRFNAEDYSAR